MIHGIILQFALLICHMVCVPPHMIGLIFHSFFHHLLSSGWSLQPLVYVSLPYSGSEACLSFNCKESMGDIKN